MQVRESVVLCLILLQNCNAFTSSKIPEHLSPCYNESMDLWPRGQHPPMYTRTLVELLRKLEHNRSDPNLRLFSNALLHTAKLDGVQRGSVTNTNLNLIPYRASGYEFIRHQLLIDHLTPGEVLGPQFPDNLNPSELCLLHFTISESLMHKRRGDESQTCPMIHDRNEIINDNEHSQCPRQMGVMYTQWGSVSVGPLISGIASALQREHVGLAKLIADINALNEWDPRDSENNTLQATRSTLNENVTTTTTTTATIHERGWQSDKEVVDNIWVATLGGILAQVVVNQVSTQPRVLSAGKWNDTLLPRTFYLNAHHWDVNNPTILGGIDALILSMEIRKWLDQYPAARLFQLIDMYYSPRGIAYDPSFRACNRFQKLDELLNTHDLVHQVVTISKLLNEYGDYPNSLNLSQVHMLSEAVVKEFKSSRASLISGWRTCEEPNGPADNRNSNDINTTGAHWEIVLITDHSYSNYDVQQLLAALAETADVSYFSSSIGLLHGNEGKWLINVTSDIVEMFSALSTLRSNEWPTGLSLTRCMHQIISYYQSVNNSQEGDVEHPVKPYGKLIAVLAQSSSLTDADLLGVQQSIDTLRGMSPETHIVYVTSAANERSFAQLAQYTRSQVAVVDTADVGAAVEVLAQAIRMLPASIVDVFAGGGGKSNFEDYLTPHPNTEAYVYEINRVYAAAANISVKFQGRGYGDLSICPYAFTDSSLASSTPTQRLEAMNTNECKRIASSMVSDEVTFNAEDYCPPRDETCSVRFAVAAANSTIRCAEVECRYPDQILLMIETSWTNSAPTLMFSTSCLSLALLVGFTSVIQMF